jgi:formylglycine-generating enzyme required for sulfatase activity
MEFVEVPAGEFRMGREDGHPCERPVHAVWVDGFSIARTPATNADFAAYLAASGAPPPRFWGRSDFADPEQPVVGLAWEEAARFAAWAGGRLPTEAEWERAARGGLEGARYPWGDERPSERFARPPPESFARPPKVGSTPANGFGLLDLSGVCHEWCSDWFDERAYARGPARNPRGPGTGTRRVSRGGAWRHADPWSPVAHRSSLPPDLRYSDYGVRPVLPSRSRSMIAPSAAGAVVAAPPAARAVVAAPPAGR